MVRPVKSIIFSVGLNDENDPVMLDFPLFGDKVPRKQKSPPYENFLGLRF